MPALNAVGPEYELAPASVSVPLPILVRPPLPEIGPESVSALFWVSTIAVPLSAIALPSESPLAAACRAVPLLKASVPVPSAAFDATASVPALSTVPPEYELAPESASVPLPILARMPLPEIVPDSVSALL